MDMGATFYNIYNDPRVYSVQDLVKRATAPNSGYIVPVTALTVLSEWLRDDPQMFSDDEIKSVITQMARAFVIEIHMLPTHRQIAEYGKIITQQFRDVLEARNETHACPDCGGDLREGVHQKQLDADWFVCEKGEDVKADYFDVNDECGV
jgi:hypothetical protein